ncbi:TAP42-like protein [Athelia psychrophila]|uniref:TAP42-like protein n=1 Tax=Athelia psychrophila TaxID=1759441 RepID=A0A166JSE0_9AGAM|nr:TAP42-like protein [Fibularhizoctonia sp. CBS 109695]
MSSDVPLPTLFTSALNAASRAYNLPTVQDETQELIRSALGDLRSLSSRISTLSLFSSNESLEDISTRDLVYLLVPFVAAELQGRVKAIEHDVRMSHLGTAQRYLKSFVGMLEQYEIVPAGDRELYEQRSGNVKDPAKRRELKIKQYQKEKELRTRIEIIRKRRRQLATSDTVTTDFDLISSLLPPPSSTQADFDDDDEDSEMDEILRETTLLLLRLTYALSQGQLESMDQELELLRSAPPPPPDQTPTDDRRGKVKDEDDIWKLDTPVVSAASGPLLDPSGKPLRPFTILPAGASDRTRLQSQVFGPGHRLPTMSIDELLQIEMDAGKFISGGGPESEADPTSSEQLAIDAEQDGTAFGEDKAEQKRQKDENWAMYTDVNAKGAGNTMNRG